MTSVPAGDHPPPEEVEAAVIAGRSQRGAGPHPGLGPVAQHVDGCEDCAALAASMLAVQRLLRAEGRRPAPPLPDHLGARLDAALARAAAERSAVALPVDLASRRPPRAPSSRDAHEGARRWP